MWNLIYATGKWLLSTFLLWSNGWERRTRHLYEKTMVEWRDPESGLWYMEKMALRILLVRSEQSYQP
jgi:hypothetical protein